MTDWCVLQAPCCSYNTSDCPQTSGAGTPPCQHTPKALCTSGCDQDTSYNSLGIDTHSCDRDRTIKPCPAMASDMAHPLACLGVPSRSRPTGSDSGHALPNIRHRGVSWKEPGACWHVLSHHQARILYLAPSHLAWEGLLTGQLAGPSSRCYGCWKRWTAALAS